VPADPQIQNVLSSLCQSERTLFETITTIRGLRERVADLGIPGLNQNGFDEAVGITVGGQPNPTPNDLSHLSRGRLRKLLAAMDLLDTWLTTAVSLDGASQTPRKAITEVIR
jgi:hypothetical protein